MSGGENRTAEDVVMISKPILITLATSLLFSTGCAAKNKWFSRRDYSEMQDPFMEGEALASDAAPAARAKGDDTGRAKLGSSLADSGRATSPSGANSPPGPKPIQRAGAIEEPGARSGRVATASYPQDPDADTSERPVVKSHQGPALSDFLNQKKSEASAAVQATEDTANQRAAAATKSVMAERNAKTAPAGSGSTAFPSLSREAENFSSFLQQSTDKVNTASQDATGAVRKTEDSVHEFADWAEQKKGEWTQDGAEATEFVKSSPAATKQTIKAAGKQAQTMANEALLDFSTPDSEPQPEFDTDESAQPLMKRFADSPAPSSQKAPLEVEDNPFENPFDTAEASPFAEKPRAAATSKSASKSDSSRKSLDDSFQMDSGWKPAHMTRP